MKLIKKKWGWELILISTELYACKLLILKGGYQCSLHHHRKKDETFILLMGNTKFTRRFLTKGSIYYLKPFIEERITEGIKHSFAGESLYSVILEVSTQDLPEDSYRDTKSGKIKGK